MKIHFRSFISELRIVVMASSPYFLLPAIIFLKNNFYANLSLITLIDWFCYLCIFL